MNKTKIKSIRNMFKMKALPMYSVKDIDDLGVENVKARFDEICDAINAKEINAEIIELIDDSKKNTAEILETIYEVQNFTNKINVLQDTINILEDRIYKHREDILDDLDIVISDVTKSIGEKLYEHIGIESLDDEIMGPNNFNGEWGLSDAAISNYDNDFLQEILRIALQVEKLDHTIVATSIVNKCPHCGKSLKKGS